jgi:hypothetical protein
MKQLAITALFSFIASAAFNQICEPTVAYNFDGNTLDVSGNDHVAELFYGASTASDYLEIGYNDDDRAEIPSEVLDELADFTVNFEFYLNDLNLSGLAPTNTFIAGASSTNESEFAISYQPDIEAIVVALKGSGEIFPITLSADNWYCLVVKRAGSMVTVYIDGTEVSSISMSPSALSIQFLEIGQELDCVTGCYATNQCLNGRIDNFSIYPCAIDNSSCQPFIASCDTTLHYRFEGDVIDESIFDYHGTLNAGASTDLNILEIGYNDDDYVEIPVGAADGLNDFAISFNFYLNALNNSGSSPTNTFIAGTDGLNMHELALSYESSSNAFEVAIHEVGGIIPAAISPNTWYCVTFYRSGDSVWIELNGTILPTTLITPEGPLNIVFLEIGQELDCPAGCFAENQSLNGKMDNLIIQDCANTISCDPVSVDIVSQSHSSLKLYPNPATEYIVVEDETPIIGIISVFDYTGKLVNRTEGNNTLKVIINTRNLDSGMYSVIILNKELILTRKLSIIK